MIVTVLHFPGQLGREGSQTRLEEVPGLAQYSVTSAAAGANHCLVVDQWGSVFSWGSDESGQLGHNQAGLLLLPDCLNRLGETGLLWFMLS